MHQRFSATLVIFITILMAFCLSILPLPGVVAWFRPPWVAMVVIYWVFALPHRFSIGKAWMVGLIADILHGTVLGEHALALTLVAYLAHKFHQQIRVYPILQQALCVMLLLMVYQGTIIMVQGAIGQMAQSYWTIFSVLVGMVLWPWVFMMLRNIRRSVGII